MKSIRRQLILTLLLGLTLLFAAASILLYYYAHDAFIEQFDESLRARMASFAGMSEMETRNGERVVELEFDDLPLPEFQPSPEAEYFQVWRQDGTVLARSASLGDADLPRPEAVKEGPEGLDIPLPDGRKGRAASLVFSPTLDASADPEGLQEDTRADRLVMVMAKSREALDGVLFTLLAGYIVTGLLLVFGIVLIVRWSVGRGLQPLDHIAGETAGIEIDNLAHRFPTEGLPQELLPICGRLNELLGRLDKAFQRERRFNADIAHELRTPLAELRTLAEVALKKEENSDYYDASRTCFRDVLAIAEQMEKLMTTLMALVRSESRHQAVEWEDLDLVELIRHTCRPYQEAAKKRGIFFELRLPARAAVPSDRTLLTAILSNLFSNAAAHTPEGGSIRCSLEAGKEGFRLCLENTNDQLAAEDLDHLFEPLWKKDPSRTDTGSNGLGLSLVASYAKLLGLDLRADLPQANVFRILISA
jgi:two-component system sensor histidine kinase QseC